MRILFVAHNEGRLRHFGGVTRMLAERGHTIRVATLENIPVPSELCHPRIALIKGPSRRVDGWRDLVRTVRVARDYVRYLSPRYAGASLPRWQAGRKVPRGFRQFCDSRPWVKRHWRLLDRALRVAEDVIPSDEAFESFLESERPDLILITPLVQHGSYQTDYVKSAHRLGLPVALLVFSWDNLTTAGLIRIIPDRVLLWNGTQKREAVELHGVPAQRVIVTGAPRFDDFFGMIPATTRDEFCERAGLDPSRPFLVYLGSAPFVAAGEADFVGRWVTEIRKSPDPALRTCGLLVRPHPGNPIALERENLPNVAVWRDPDKANADPWLYDSLYHAAAAVGLNTSAMIQAGVLGKPVHTIVLPQFEGQRGTLHFDYLLHANGGLVSAARDFDEHRRQLAESLRLEGAPCQRSLRFVEGFVRPHGLDVPATPIMVGEIERLSGLRKRRRRAPLWHYPAGWALRAWLTARISPDRAASRKARRPKKKLQRRAGKTDARDEASTPKASGTDPGPASRRSVTLDGVPDEVLIDHVAQRLRQMDRGKLSSSLAALVGHVPEEDVARFYVERSRTKATD